jgi:hypothetical protein
LANGTLAKEEGAGNSILGGSNTAPNGAGFNTVSGQISGASVNSGTATHSALYTITRNPDGSLSLSASIDGGSPATGTTGTSPHTYTFNQIGIGGGNANNSYSIDNVLIEVIPEPSAALLTALGALALAGVRRRR